MESVDRNPGGCFCFEVINVVALRMESVDRNTLAVERAYVKQGSLSVWRAWIEICVRAVSGKYGKSRSPYGERG